MLYNTAIHPLPPPVTVYLDRTLLAEIPLEEKIKEQWDDMRFKTGRMCDRHRTLIIIGVVLVCIGSIVASVIIKSNMISISPCFNYASDTLASSVSAECVNYLWNSFQCSTALQSNPSWHWWIQSPQGTLMVKCDATHKGLACGAGSYQTISNYLSLCNPYFGQ